MLMVFSFNQDNNPSINLLTIAVITFSLQTHVCFVRVYKNVLCNILEVTSLINVGFLSVATFYQLLNDNSLIITTKLSTCIAFVAFLFITVYHAVQ